MLKFALIKMGVSLGPWRRTDDTVRLKQTRLDLCVPYGRRRRVKIDDAAMIKLAGCKTLASQLAKASVRLGHTA